MKAMLDVFSVNIAVLQAVRDAQKEKHGKSRCLSASYLFPVLGYSETLCVLPVQSLPVLNCNSSKHVDVLLQFSPHPVGLIFFSVTLQGSSGSAGPPSLPSSSLRYSPSCLC